MTGKPDESKTYKHPDLHSTYKIVDKTVGMDGIVIYDIQDIHAPKRPTFSARWPDDFGADGWEVVE